MRRIALLTNPESGSGDAESVGALMREFGAEVEEFRLEDVDQALAGSPDRLVAAGGDGSLGCVAAAAAGAAIPFAVVPTGTANDFARALGIPLDTEEAIHLAAQGATTKRIDIARMDDRPFLNLASLGLSPAAAAHASGLKGAFGPLAYTFGALRAGLGARPVTCAVRCDGRGVFEGEAWQVSVASTGAFGGGSSVEAHPADGRLDVVAIEAGSRIGLLRRAHGLRLGEIEGQPGVTKARCAAAEIELAGTEPFNVDGELVESGTCRFELEPQAVAVVVA